MSAHCHTGRHALLILPSRHERAKLFIFLTTRTVPHSLQTLRQAYGRREHVQRGKNKNEQINRQIKKNKNKRQEERLSCASELGLSSLRRLLATSRRSHPYLRDSHLYGLRRDHDARGLATIQSRGQLALMDHRGSNAIGRLRQAVRGDLDQALVPAPASRQQHTGHWIWIDIKKISFRCSHLEPRVRRLKSWARVMSHVQPS